MEMEFQRLRGRTRARAKLQRAKERTAKAANQPLDRQLSGLQSAFHGLSKLSKKEKKSSVKATTRLLQ
jgi:hypothetical protein